VAATLVYLASFPVRALRWRLILRVQKALPMRVLMSAVFVGYMANNVLPARAGEVYRAHFLGRRAGISRSGAAASIVVERALDGLMLVGAILFVFLAFPREDYLGGAALATGLIFVSLATGILFYGLQTDRTRGFLERALGLLPRALHERLAGRVGSFLLGVRGISTPRELLEAGAYTALVWVLDACAVALVVVSFGVTLPPVGYVLVFALVALSGAFSVRVRPLLGVLRRSSGDGAGRLRRGPTLPARPGDRDRARASLERTVARLGALTRRVSRGEPGSKKRYACARIIIGPCESRVCS